MRSLGIKKKPVLFIMYCELCKEEHDFCNPQQFSSWVRRHRKKKHSTVRGRITFKRKDTPGVFAPMVPAIIDAPTKS